MLLELCFFKKTEYFHVFFFSLQADNAAAVVMNAARTHTYIGILPTHKALHPSSLGHWPVDLSGGNRGHLLGTIQLVIHHQHL